MFEFWFKYPPVLFERGSIVFTTGGSWLLLVLLALATVASGVAYLGAPARLRWQDRVVLFSLRFGVLVVLAVLLSRPVLVVPVVKPQENALAVLLDDSRSMQVADAAGRTRGALLGEILSAGESALLPRLRSQFKVQLYRFSDRVERISELSELGFQGPRTDLAAALDRVRRDLQGVPSAGIVLLTDGGHNSSGSLSEVSLELAGAGFPVYAIGLGSDRLERDIEVARVDGPAEVLKGSTVTLEVLIGQRGYDGRTVRVQIEDNGRIAATRDVKLERREEGTLVPVPLELRDAGLRLVTVYVPPGEGEQVTENNRRDLLVVVRDRREKVLYFEGEPRFEVKFLRRAVAGDENLQLVVLQRTAENKFLRLDVDSEEELAAGFPKTRAELFRYRALILGSVEASFFTHDQLQMIADFVRQRGGGLLLLGGRLALSEGGYAETPVADALPVVLYRRSPQDTGVIFREIKVEPTIAGLIHPALQLAAEPEASLKRWASLPALSTVNSIREVKPAATTLLVGRRDGGGEAIPVLIAHRYGKGKVAVFAVQDSWLWQMHSDVPLEDLTHETLWRQLLRWLLSGVPDAVSASATPVQAAPGEAVRITAEVVDSNFLGVNDALVTLRLTSPDGSERELTLDWSVARDGVYQATWVAESPGLYEGIVEARSGGRLLGATKVDFRSGGESQEFFAPVLRRAPLERLAEETGGRFYTPGEAAKLPDEVRYSSAGVSALEEYELWNMPAALVLLLALLGSEWSYRRFRGLI